MAKAQKKSENAEAKPFSLIPEEKLLSIYTAMLKCRLLEQRATSLFQHGKLDRDLHASAGREATAAAAVIDLQPADTLCIAPGDWLPAFVKGLTPETLFRVLVPSSAQLNSAIEMEAAQKNILSPSASSDLSEAVIDKAAAASSAKNGAVSLAFIGSGDDSLSQWQKAIQASATKKLPVIFVHFLELSEPASSTRSQKPDALIHGVPSIAADALDPVAVYRVAYEAMVRARQLRGATLLQCILSTQQPTASPSLDSLPPQALIDSVDAMEKYLSAKKIDFDDPKSQTLANFSHDLDLATRFLDR